MRKVNNYMKIFNMYQANFLIKNGCAVAGCGLQGKAFIEFIRDEIFNKYMDIWMTRKH